MNFRFLLTASLLLMTFPVFAQPKLVVGIVVDQMSYDYLYRFYDQFGKDGFRRLMDKGTNFRNVTYDYVPTYTGPGHASVYTGTTPANHGIAANEWFHRAYGREVNCVEDTTVQSIGTTSSDGQCSPHFLRANTITDQLRLTYPLAKVVGVSIKDRSAILPAGHIPNGAYWYDYATGGFVTSSFYAKALPTWATDFQTNHPVAGYMDQVWNLLQPAENYHYRNLDQSPYEQLLGGKTTPTFPYDFTKLPLTQRLELFTGTPFANTYLTDFAINTLHGEGMGADHYTDFLAISYSTPDIAGHAFGPYSLEIEDMYLRLDADLARLFKELDKTVGKGEYVVFLTADHAVVPVPQYLADKHLPGGYLFLNERLMSLRQASVARFGEDIIEKVQNNNVYLKTNCLNSPKILEYLAFLKNEIALWPEVKQVYDESQLRVITSEDPWLNMVAAGYDRERSGEVIFILQPGYLTKSVENERAKQGTSHGSAFNYDTHVPMLFYGEDVPKQEVFTPYTITDIAATLVHILNVQRPNAMTGQPMTELFADD